MSKGKLTLEGKTLIDCVWFQTQEEIIGIVVYSEGKSSSVKASIGKAVCGNDIEDSFYIIKHGAPYPIKSAFALFGDKLNSKFKVTSCDYYSCLAELLIEANECVLHPHSYENLNLQDMNEDFETFEKKAVSEKH